MHYYVLPGTGVFGGVKKGWHCADHINHAGVPCLVATPDGDIPRWFESRTGAISHDRLALECREDDTLLFSCYSDAPLVDRLPAERKILHMQGADPVTFPLMRPERGYEIISAGLHMTQELLAHGRVAPYVPMGVPNVFRGGAEMKAIGSVLVLSRRGGEFVEAVRRGASGLGHVQVVGDPPLGEADLARVMRGTDMFVAVSKNEWFGLPPLEAMAAGCAVVGFPGVGGFEFMRHGETAHLALNGDAKSLEEAVRFVLQRTNYRNALASRGMDFASYYTMEREGRMLLQALGIRRER